MCSPLQGTRTSQSEHYSMTHYKHSFVEATRWPVCSIIQFTRIVFIVSVWTSCHELLVQDLWSLCFGCHSQETSWKWRQCLQGPARSTSNCIRACRSGSRGLRHHGITCRRVHWRVLIPHLYSCFFHFAIARADVVYLIPLKKGVYPCQRKQIRAALQTKNNLVGNWLYSCSQHAV